MVYVVGRTEVSTLEQPSKHTHLHPFMDLAAPPHAPDELPVERGERADQEDAEDGHAGQVAVDAKEEDAPPNQLLYVGGRKRGRDGHEKMHAPNACAAPEGKPSKPRKLSCPSVLTWIVCRNNTLMCEDTTLENLEQSTDSRLVSSPVSRPSKKAMSCRSSERSSMERARVATRVPARPKKAAGR